MLRIGNLGERLIAKSWSRFAQFAFWVCLIVLVIQITLVPGLRRTLRIGLRLTHGKGSQPRHKAVLYVSKSGELSFQPKMNESTSIEETIISAVEKLHGSERVVELRAHPEATLQSVVTAVSLVKRCSGAVAMRDHNQGQYSEPYEIQVVEYFDLGSNELSQSEANH